MSTSRCNILCVARSAGFWTTHFCAQYFPNTILLPARPTRLAYLVGALRTFLGVLQARPDVLLCGTSTKIPVLFALLRKWGMFRKMRIVTDCQFMHLYDLAYIDRVIVYSPEEIALFPEKWHHKITPLWWPSKAELVDIVVRDEGYVFAGGNHLRDHDTFLRAMEGSTAPAVLYTGNTLTAPIPSNVEVHAQAPLEEYLQSMAGGHVVVVPLIGNTTTPHGHCDISTALSMGKIVITTRGATADSYIDEGRNGILVEPGSVEGYRKAIETLYKDSAKYIRMSEYAKQNAERYKYEAYAKKVLNICHEVVAP
jgi:hypothetical protein